MGFGPFYIVNLISVSHDRNAVDKSSAIICDDGVDNGGRERCILLEIRHEITSASRVISRKSVRSPCHICSRSNVKCTWFSTRRIGM
jgi:hypothetical protein